MDYMIEYWKEKETNPIEFLNHFRCTTEPIGGGTEYDTDGELVSYDAAVDAIDIAKKDSIEKACEWLESALYSTHDNCGYKVTASFDSVDKKEFIEDFKKAMED